MKFQNVVDVNTGKLIHLEACLIQVLKSFITLHGSHIKVRIKNTLKNVLGKVHCYNAVNRPTCLEVILSRIFLGLLNSFFKHLDVVVTLEI